jgi:hypothetical protein
MKVLIASAENNWSGILRESLEALSHRVLVTSESGDATKWLRDWQPDILVTEENIRRGDRDSGLRLAELCTIASEQGHGAFRTQTLILLPVADWDRIKRAQRTGAHVIVKSSTFDAVVRYIQTVADNLTTDKALGPMLIGLHQFPGRLPDKSCQNCKWVGASLSYETSKTDVQLTAVRATIFNCLLFSRRGMSPAEVVKMANEQQYFRLLLKGRPLRESAIKMEITRLRRDIGEALERIGVPYGGGHFLPPVSHGIEKYRLTGNWHLFHVPSKCC